MNKNLLTLLLLLCIVLVSCGGNNPEISNIIVKSDSQGVLLDTGDSSKLSILQKIFYEKEESPDAGPEFKYLIDITIGDETTRWQYSINGYIRNYEETNSMIYLLKDTPEFNRTANIQ